MLPSLQLRFFTYALLSAELCRRVGVALRASFCLFYFTIITGFLLHLLLQKFLRRIEVRFVYAAFSSTTFVLKLHSGGTIFDFFVSLTPEHTLFGITLIVSKTGRTEFYLYSADISTLAQQSFSRDSALFSSLQPNSSPFVILCFPSCTLIPFFSIGWPFAHHWVFDESCPHLPQLRTSSLYFPALYVRVNHFVSSAPSCIESRTQTKMTLKSTVSLLETISSAYAPSSS